MFSPFYFNSNEIHTALKIIALRIRTLRVKYVVPRFKPCKGRRMRWPVAKYFPSLNKIKIAALRRGWGLSSALVHFITLCSYALSSWLPSEFYTHMLQNRTAFEGIKFTGLSISVTGHRGSVVRFLAQCNKAMEFHALIIFSFSLLSLRLISSLEALIKVEIWSKWAGRRQHKPRKGLSGEFGHGQDTR